MNLYIDDLERILAVSKVHESINRKFGMNQLCNMNAIDSNGNNLGVIESDQQGKTCFKINTIGKKHER